MGDEDGGSRFRLRSLFCSRTLPVAAPVDAQLPHSSAQRVRIDAEQTRSTVRAFDATARCDQRLRNVFRLLKISVNRAAQKEKVGGIIC